MQKRILAAVIFVLVSSALFAYNPPAGGQNLFNLASPANISSASSSAGGALMNVTPFTVLNNPAIAAYEQRAMIDVAGTIMANGGSGEKVGGAFQTGVLVPTRLLVFGVGMHGNFAEFEKMPLGDSISFIGTVAKDINDRLSFGANVKIGGFWGAGNDFMIASDVGAFYNFGKIAFMKNFRVGAAVLNIGKVFTSTKTLGIKDTKASWWPGFCTLRAGAAATMVENDAVAFGTSLDISIPEFQNAVFDLGLALDIKCIKNVALNVATAWQIDCQEVANGHKNLAPSISLSAKFQINASKNAFMQKNEWGNSEVTTGLAYKNLYSDVNAISFQGLIKLGAVDNVPPKITLWDEE